MPLSRTSPGPSRSRRRAASNLRRAACFRRVARTGLDGVVFGTPLGTPFSAWWRLAYLARHAHVDRQTKESPRRRTSSPTGPPRSRRGVRDVRVARGLAVSSCTEGRIMLGGGLAHRHRPVVVVRGHLTPRGDRAHRCPLGARPPRPPRPPGRAANTIRLSNTSPILQWESPRDACGNGESTPAAAQRRSGTAPYGSLGGTCGCGALPAAPPDGRISEEETPRRAGGTSSADTNHAADFAKAFPGASAWSAQQQSNEAKAPRVFPRPTKGVAAADDC